MTADIKEIFMAIANQNDEAAGTFIRVPDVWVSPVYYQYLRNLHRDAVAFVDKIEIVMDDGEHQLLMSEGQQCGFILPDAEAFRKKLYAFRDHLKSYDPTACRSVKRIDCSGLESEVVILPIKVAKGFLSTAINSAEFIDTFLSSMRQSEYFVWLRELKAMGAPYAGPTSVREYFTTSFSLHMASRQAQEEFLPPRMPPNWARRVPQIA